MPGIPQLRVSDDAVLIVSDVRVLCTLHNAPYLVH